MLFSPVESLAEKRISWLPWGDQKAVCLPSMQHTYSSSVSYMYCLVSGDVFRIEFPRLEANFVGSGDVFAALLLAWSEKHPDNLQVCDLLSTLALK